jgi:hypothetical protein
MEYQSVQAGIPLLAKGRPLVSISEQPGYGEDPRFGGVVTFVAENREHGYFWIISLSRRP